MAVIKKSLQEMLQRMWNNQCWTGIKEELFYSCWSEYKYTATMDISLEVSKLWLYRVMVADKCQNLQHPLSWSPRRVQAV